MGLVDSKDISGKAISDLFSELNYSYYLSYYDNNGELPKDFFLNVLSILINDLKLNDYVNDICFDDNCKILNNSNNIINPAAYNFKSKKIVICPSVMDIYSNYLASNNGYVYGDKLSPMIETFFVLGHEVEHANQLKKINRFSENEDALLSILERYPSVVFKGVPKKIVNMHCKDVYDNFYDIVPKERLANFYAAFRIYLMGYYSCNDVMKKDGLRRMYKAILKGYGTDEICNSKVNLIGVEEYAPSIRYLSELLNCSDSEAKSIYDRFLRNLDDEEKLKLGLLVNPTYLNNSKNIYNRLSM